MQAESGKQGPKIGLQLRKASRRHLYQIRRFVSRPVRVRPRRAVVIKRKKGGPTTVHLFIAGQTPHMGILSRKNHKSTIAK